MQRYDTYKDSGVKWLGEIPSHWEVIKTSHLFTHIGSGTTPKSGSEEYYTEDGIPFLQTGDLNDGFIVDTSKKITEKALRDTNLTIYLQGSLVIAMYGATIGKLGILGIDTTVNQACCVLPKSPKVETRFAFYAYLAAKNDLIFQSKGGGQPNISQDTIKNERIPVPSRAEQTAIANYLDTATSKIDAAIAQQQKMIDLLNERKQIIINRVVTKGLNPNAKMKDSGVEWIGVIPEKWEVCALKHYCLLTNGDRGPNYPSGEDIKDSGVLFATADNIHGLRIEVKDGTKYITKEKYNTLRGAKMRKGDIVFCLRGAGFGNCAINDLFDEGTIASSLVNITPLNIDCEFMNYVLHSAYIRMQEIFSSNGSCADNVSAQDLGDYLIVVPPKDDQKKIVNAITSTILPIDRLIKNTNNQISLLQERKQIIINEVVTGKVKVTN